MSLYLAGLVNPSGLEIAAATAFWTAGVVLVCERLHNPPAGLCGVLALSGATFTLVRGISPFWVACSLLVLALVPGRHALAAALRERRLRLALGAVVLASIGALAWIVPEHALLQFHRGHPGVPAAVSSWTILETAFLHNRFYLADMVGVFGAFDAYSPLVSYAIWALLLGVLLFAATRAGGRRVLMLLGVLVLGVLLLPVLISASHAHQYGYNWSGRDTLPLGVGLPILAVGLLGGRAGEGGWRPSWPRFSTLFLSLWAVAQFLAFAEALRRNAVGTRGAILGFVVHASWRPAIGILPALLLEIAALGALIGLALVVATPRRRREGAPPEIPAEPPLLVRRPLPATR